MHMHMHMHGVWLCDVVGDSRFRPTQYTVISTKTQTAMQMGKRRNSLRIDITSFGAVAHCSKEKKNANEWIRIGR